MGQTRPVARPLLGWTGRWPGAGGLAEFPPDGASRGGTCFPRASPSVPGPAGLLAPGAGARGLGDAGAGGGRPRQRGQAGQVSPFPVRPPVDRQVVGERTSLPLLRRRDLWGLGLGLGIPDTHEAVGTEAVQGD